MVVIRTYIGTQEICKDYCCDVQKW